MNYLSKITAGVLALLIGLPQLSMAQLKMSANKNDTKPQPVKVTLDPSKVKVGKRPEIPFKPIEMKNHKTGAEIPPDQIPSGHSLIAGVDC